MPITNQDCVIATAAHLLQNEEAFILVAKSKEQPGKISINGDLSTLIPVFKKLHIIAPEIRHIIDSSVPKSPWIKTSTAFPPFDGETKGRDYEEDMQVCSKPVFIKFKNQTSYHIGYYALGFSGNGGNFWEVQGIGDANPEEVEQWMVIPE